MDETTRAALLALYDELDADIAAINPRCEVSGRCCRFGEYGHTLFLSDPEAALLLEPGLPANRAIDRESCPFQIERLCTARERRPLGCRVFFCDPSYQARQQELSEEYVRRLKELHDRAGLGWNYRPLFVQLSTAQTRAAPSSPASLTLE